MTTWRHDFISTDQDSLNSLDLWSWHVLVQTLDQICQEVLKSLRKTWKSQKIYWQSQSVLIFVWVFINQYHWLWQLRHNQPFRKCWELCCVAISILIDTLFFCQDFQAYKEVIFWREKPCNDVYKMGRETRKKKVVNRR